MSHFTQDLRFALRALRRQAGFTTAAALTLALGIGATTAIFTVVNAVLLRPLPFRDSDRIVALGTADKATPDVMNTFVSPVGFTDWKSASRSFSSMAAYSTTNLTLTEQGEPELIPTARVTPEFFEVFGSPPVMGRAFTAEEDLPEGPLTVIVSHGFWQDRLGGAGDVLGQTLMLDGNAHEIVGVAPAGFSFPRSDIRLWRPVRNNPENCGRGCVFLQAAGRLAPGVTLEQAQADLRAIGLRLETEFPDANANRTIAAKLLQDVTVENVRTALFVLLAAVAMVLLIACANVANLLLVRGASRNSEMAVRAVLGGSKSRLVTQLMTESVVLALIGGTAGVLLASWGVDALRSMAPSNLPRMDGVALDGASIGFAFALVIVTSLIFGLVPALTLSQTSLGSVLRQGTRGAGGSRRAGFGRAAILVTEVALSVVLLLGAGLLLRSFIRIVNVDPGYRSEQLVHFSLSMPASRYPEPAQAQLAHEQVRERLKAMPGVRSVSLIAGMPLGGPTYFSGFSRPDLPPPAPGEDLTAMIRPADENYFDQIGISLLRGRGIEATDRQGTQPVIVISQLLADRYFPGEEPIGKTIDNGVWFGYPDSIPRTIVGIVEDIRSMGVTEELIPEMYVPFAQTAPRGVAYMIETSLPPGDVFAAARAEVRAVDPNLPLVRPGTLRELMSDDLARPTFYLALLSLFAVLAVTLAAVGIYGVVAYLVSRRTREIGVRMALGARADEVVKLVVWQGLRPALIGIVIGVVGALAGGRIIGSLLYDVPAQDPITFGGVSLLLVAVVLIACALPARRATRIPPAIALRSE